MHNASTSELQGYGLAGHGVVVLDPFDSTSRWRTRRGIDCSSESSNKSSSSDALNRVLDGFPILPLQISTHLELCRRYASLGFRTIYRNV